MSVTGFSVNSCRPHMESFWAEEWYFWSWTRHLCVGTFGYWKYTIK